MQNWVTMYYNLPFGTHITSTLSLFLGSHIWDTWDIQCSTLISHTGVAISQSHRQRAQVREQECVRLPRQNAVFDLYTFKHPLSGMPQGWECWESHFWSLEGESVLWCPSHVVFDNKSRHLLSELNLMFIHTDRNIPFCPVLPPTAQHCNCEISPNLLFQ